MIRGKIKKMMAAALAAIQKRKLQTDTQRRYICTTGQSI